MQRLFIFSCQSQKQLMKHCWYLLLIGLFVLSCSKKDEVVVTGVVVSKGGFNPNGYVVEIDHPDPNIHNFICPAGPASGGLIYSCRNAIFFINIPDPLAIPGVRIRFTKWSDKGPNLLSSFSGIAHDVEIYDASIIR
jgi:hypothetical protein